MVGKRTHQSPPSDPDAGLWQGRSVARRVRSADGMVVLVGRTARDNDILTFKLASPRDFWFHVSGASGSHVVVRNPDGVESLPRDTKRLAAGLAAGHSKARRGGRLTVHMTRCRHVTKPRGMPAGKVRLNRYETIRVTPIQIDDIDEEGGGP